MFELWRKERKKKKNLTGGLFLHICGFQTMNPDDLSSVVTAPPLCFRMNFIVTIPSSKLVLISPSFWWLNRASQSCWLERKYCTVSLQSEWMANGAIEVRAQTPESRGNHIFHYLQSAVFTEEWRRGSQKGMDTRIWGGTARSRMSGSWEGEIDGSVHLHS